MLLFTDKEQIPLKTYAEFLGAGILRITSGAVKDIPTIETFRMIRCSITGWRPVAVMVASGDLFKSEYSERRMIPIAQRPVGVTAVTVRVADLEKPERIAELHNATAGLKAVRTPISFSSSPPATSPTTTRSGCARARSDSLRVALQPAPRCRERARREHHAADAQRDHDDVPQRPAVIEKRKIEAVEAVIEPAIEPAQALFFPGRSSMPRIEIEPRALRIVIANA